MSIVSNMFSKAGLCRLVAGDNSESLKRKHLMGSSHKAGPDPSQIKLEGSKITGCCVIKIDGQG